MRLLLRRNKAKRADVGLSVGSKLAQSPLETCAARITVCAVEQSSAGNLQLTHANTDHTMTVGFDL